MEHRSGPADTAEASVLPTAIDAHQHFWPAGVRPRDPRTAALNRAFSPEDLSRELAGGPVTGTVLVQCVPGEEENDRLAAYADEFSPTGAIVAWLPLDDADAARNEAARVRERTPLLRGFRDKLPASADVAAVSGTAALAADRGLVWEVLVVSDTQSRLVEEVAVARPDLRIVVSHLATPPLAGGDPQSWKDRIDRLAALPSVAIKLSVGADVLVGWQWAPNELTPFVEHALTRFGPRRSMLAGNWPVVRLAAGHRAAWNALLSAAERAGASPGELGQITSATARSWYRIG